MSRSFRTHRAGKTCVPRRLLQDDNQVFEMRLLLLLKTSRRRGKEVDLASFAIMDGCSAEKNGARKLTLTGVGVGEC